VSQWLDRVRELLVMSSERRLPWLSGWNLGTVTAVYTQKYTAAARYSSTLWKPALCVLRGWVVLKAGCRLQPAYTTCEWSPASIDGSCDCESSPAAVLVGLGELYYASACQFGCGLWMMISCYLLWPAHCWVRALNCWLPLACSGY
jgi:hypothetical protein